MTGRKIALGTAAGGAYTFIAALYMIVQLRLVISHLPVQIAGVWVLFLTLGTYLAFFDLGVSPTLGREISFVIGDRGRQEANETMADMVATAAAIFRALALLAFLVAAGAGAWFVAGHQLTGGVGLAWLIFALGAAVNLLTSVPFAALFGFGHVATEKLVRTGSLLLGLAGTYVVLWLGYGLVALALVWTLQGVVARFAAGLFLRRWHPDLARTKGKVRWELARSFAAPSLKWAAIQLGTLLIFQTGNVVIAFTLGTASIPSYEAASRIATTLLTLASLVAISSTPFISRAYAAQEMDTAADLLLRNVRIAVAFMILLSSFAAVFADRIIGLWLGPAHFIGFPVVWILLATMLLEVHHVTFASATMAAGHIVFLPPALIAGALNLIISFSLAPRYGIVGVVVGIMVAQLLTNNWYAPLVTLRIFRLSARSIFRSIWRPLLILGAAQLAITIGVRYLWSGSHPGDLVVLLASVFIVTLFWIPMAAFLILTNEERQIARQWMRAILPGSRKARIATAQ